MIIKLPFGLREGKLIHISDIFEKENGLKCNCVCSKCHQQLQARKGNVRVHHFAHNNASCKTALETSLHIFAKEVLEKNKKLKLPPLEYEYKDYNYFNVGTPKFEYTIQKRTEREDCGEIEFDRVEIEKAIGGIRPDIILYKKHNRLLVEIKVTHKVDDEKLAKIKNLNESAIEISLDPKSYNFYSFDKLDLENEIVHSIDNKKWVNNKKLPSKIREKEIAVEKERELKVAEYNRKMEEIQQQKADRIGELQKYFDLEYKKDKISKFRETLSYDNSWRKNLKELGLDAMNLPEFINAEIPGELAIECHRVIWQSVLLKVFVNGKIDKDYKVSDVVEWIKTYSKLPLNNELIDTKDVNEIKVPDLVDCIFNYFTVLDEFKILTCINRSSFYNSKFEVNCYKIKQLSGMSKSEIQSLIGHNNNHVGKEKTSIKNNLNNYEKSRNTLSEAEHPLLGRNAVCEVCGQVTNDWVSLDGKTNICLCRECSNCRKN